MTALKWTGLNELREKYLSFFESKEHLRLASAPLVPRDDGSLLLINSGMAPLKNYFLGLEKPPNKRVTTCQKCIRTPDIEQVGKTSRHGTYFEMLGNFSFGDYFKEDATKWAWEFMTDILKVPTEKLWVTVYEEDEDAFKIWTENRGVDASRVVRLGKADNFWEIGSGPCGPCSEIFVDRGEEYTCDAPKCGIGYCDCDRFMEVWNLVFTQFNSDGEGNYTPLEHPNIDTGMGLERLACVMQEVDNLFEVDTVQNIMKEVSSISGISYHANEKHDISLRVVADHIRSTVFMIGDGVIPANEGRGYVLRRLLRRAARHGRLLGISDTFLHIVCETVINENKSTYPELEENKNYIKKIVLAEEERFAKTIEQGMDMLNDIMDAIDSVSMDDKVIDGKEAFKLYDTFGFPFDLTREIAEDAGIIVDEEGFLKEMEIQRQRARKAHQAQGGVGWEEDILAVLDLEDSFVGYELLETKTSIPALIQAGQLVESLLEGQEGMVVLKETPFYAESGGQIGDQGLIYLGNNKFQVEDTKTSPTGHILHIGKVLSGRLKVSDKVVATVGSLRRARVIRNHSATHLMHAALREILGDHVHQAGSFVDENITRFDFTHFEAVTEKELQQVEQWVNERILESLPVTVELMDMDAARGKGAMALFGDTYGDTVRVCSMGDASMELCGGTHVNNTAEIGLFKILSESSVAAGVRRIEATTSLGVLDALTREQKRTAFIAKVLKVNNPSELVARAKGAMEQVALLEKELATLEAQIANIRTEDMEHNVEKIGEIGFVAIAISGSIAPLQQRADQIKDKEPHLVGVFIALGEDSAAVLAFAGKDAVKAGIHSGKLVQQITAIGGGKGGGRPDNAKGSMPDLSKVDDALVAAKGFVKAQLGL